MFRRAKLRATKNNPARTMRVMRVDLLLVSDLLISFVSLALVNHLVLVHLLGLETWVCSPTGMRRSFLFGVITALLLCVVTLLGWLILTMAAMAGNNDAVGWLALPVFAVSAALLVGPLQSATRHLFPADGLALAEVMPWAAVNSAVIGTAITAWQRLDSLWSVIGYVAASALAFLVFLMCFAAIRERTSTSDVPASFQGTPVLLLSAAIMSLAIMAFDGVAPTWVTP